MRDLIISEIKRLASERGGKPPGVAAFASATGITQGKWSGVIWARWGDALSEAGFEPNQLQTRHDSLHIVQKIAELVREVGKLPSRAEMRLRRKTDTNFPNHTTISNHFPNNAALVAAIRSYASENHHNDVLSFLADKPTSTKPKSAILKSEDGVVYLLKSGAHFKIGRTDNIERRIREITVSLPETVTIIHTIRTDDPVGIEGYWHKRFAEYRAQGEWFRLEPEHIRAFRRRTFQ